MCYSTAQLRVLELFQGLWPALNTFRDSISWATSQDQQPPQAAQLSGAALRSFAWENGDKRPLVDFIEALRGVQSDHSGEAIFPDLDTQWRASDCCMLLGDYEQALAFFPDLPIARQKRSTEQMLALRLLTGRDVEAKDLLTLCGPQVTEFGKRHLREILQVLESLLEESHREWGQTLLAEWVEGSRTYQYQIFIAPVLAGPAIQSFSLPMHCNYQWELRSEDLGKPNRGVYLSVDYWDYGKAVTVYEFSQNRKVVRFIKELTKQAENSVRAYYGIPKIGEGWIGETELFYAVRDAFHDLNVQQHATPPWLGRQHLDVFIPQLSVALEYQGEQHDQPVDYFGGIEAFSRTKQRDARKRRLCRRHGVRLIEVRSGYELEALIKEITSPQV